MQYPFTTVLAVAAFAVGLVIAQPVQARGDTISDEEAGMVCDESTLGYYLDIRFPSVPVRRQGLGEHRRRLSAVARCFV